MKIIGVIPARLNSTRLPRKVLLDIAGYPMIEHVYRRALKCKSLNETLIATDSQEVFEVCESKGMQAMMTGEHPSGSDRLFEVLSKTNGDVYVNIQGDEPTLDPALIDLLLSPFFEDEETQVSTLCAPLLPDEESQPSSVKVVLSEDGHALYFSRSLIPFDREGTEQIERFKHIGLYAYQRDALTRFHGLPPSPLEQIEKLEQLRFLSHRIPIRVLKTNQTTIGVDTEEDLLKANLYFRAHPHELPQQS